VRPGDGADVDVRQGITVDDEKCLRGEEGQCEARTAGASKHDRLFPRIPDVSSQVAAVADDGRQRFGTMVEVQNEVGHAAGHQPADDPPNHRLSGDRDGRFRADDAEGAQPRAMTGRQDQCVADAAAGGLNEGKAL
jgi:hypothetical protein